MAFVGAGVGMVMQNLVLVVQNSVHREDIGAGSSLIAFFRSLGGAIGVSVLGAVLATHARDTIAAGLRDLGIDPSKLGGGGASGVPDVDTLPVPVAHVVEHAFGTGIAEAFLFAVPLGLVALLALSLMHERPLGAKSGIQIAAGAGGGRRVRALRATARIVTDTPRRAARAEPRPGRRDRRAGRRPGRGPARLWRASGLGGGRRPALPRGGVLDPGADRHDGLPAPAGLYREPRTFTVIRIA
jgi:hypothetical protein